MLLVSLDIYIDFYLCMVDLDIEGSAGWCATISIKILFWFSQKCILLFTMDFLVKYISPIGYQCYIMLYGLVGIVFSLMFLNR